MKTLLIHNGTVITLGKNNRVLENHSVFVRNGRIEKIIPAEKVATELSKADRTLDARGSVIMPGFINTHMHFYSTMVRGLGKATPSSNFLEVLNNLWWRLDRCLSLEDSYYSAMVPLLAAIRSGTTTLIDHHASPFAVTGSLSSIAQAVKETGLRASLCYEVSDRDGAAIANEGLTENIEFAKSCAAEKGDFLRSMLGLHASFTLSDSTLERAVQMGRDANLGFHVHTAEDASDQASCIKDHGIRVVERFHKFGLLGKKTICAHGVHLSNSEIELLAQTQTPVVHNPQSNMNNAVGVADILKMTANGVLVGLGTDAMTVNMKAEVRAALWLQKLSHNNPSVGFCETLATLLENNGAIAERQWPGLKLGEISEHAAADMVLINYAPPTPLSSETFLGHFAFGISEAAVRSTIVAGRVLMHNSIIEIPIDEERVSARSQELAQKLWDRF